MTMRIPGNRLLLKCRLPGLAVVAMALFAGPGTSGAGGILSPDSASKSAETGRITLIDVRSPREWRQTAIPFNGRAIMVHNPNGVSAFIKKILQAVNGEKSHPVALLCAADVRSARALRTLESEEFTDVYDVSAGMSVNTTRSGWIARGLPTKPSKGRNTY